MSWNAASAPQFTGSGVCSQVPESRVNNVVEYIQAEAEKTNHMVMPRQFEHPDCPPLQ